MKKYSRHLALATVSAAVLAACGGGGGSDGPDAPTAGPITLSGTAAKGAALAGATISARCATGSGTATADANGVYSLAIASAALPCVVRASGAGADSGLVFHSVVAGADTSGTFVANITPLSELVTTNLAGAAPGSYYDAYAGAAISAASVTAAINYLKAAVASITDLGSANPLTDTLVIGNALDLKIDALMSALASNTLTLAEVSAAIVANPTAPTVVAAPIAPASSDCAWLKSGKYRMINPYETDPRWKAHLLTVDAAALTAIDQDAANITLTPNGGCQYTIAETDYTNTVMVSSGGVLVVYSQSTTDATDRSMTIGLPEQALPVSALAGTWNIAGWDPASGTATTTGYVAQSDEITFDANGVLVSGQECVGLAACTAKTAPFPTFTPNATGGGFDVAENGSTTARAFVYKTLAGKAVMVFVANDGQFIVGTRKEALGALPAVGSVSDFREFNLNGNGSISTLLDQSVSVTAVDATAKTATRLRASDGRVDTIAFDSPRDGLRYRAVNSCTINGVASNCAATVQFPLQGMGITLSQSVGITTPASAFTAISIGKPAALN